MKLDFLTVGRIYIESLYKIKDSQITEFKEKLTGECLSIAINGSVLKAKTGIVACVGRDAYGITELLERYNVDYSNLILSNEKSGRIVNLGKKYIFEGANKFLKLDPDILERAKIIHVCDDLEIAKKVMKMNKKCILSSSLDTEADIIFSEKEGTGNRILLGEKIRFKNKTFDTKFKKKNKSAFIAGFLARYCKTQSFDSSLRYGISWVA